MNSQAQSFSTLPGFAPAKYELTAPTSTAPPQPSMSTTPDVKPSSLGLQGEFEQEAA